MVVDHAGYDRLADEVDAPRVRTGEPCDVLRAADRDDAVAFDRTA
jgi:hypothetical protein